MNTVPFMTLFTKETKRFFRVWTQTFVPPVLTAVLYILIFGVSIGSKIDTVNGVSYLQFIIPGLVMMSVIMSSYANTSTSVYLAKFQGSIQELLISPMSNFSIVSAIILAGVVRGILVGSIVTIIASFFTDLVFVHPLMTMFFVVFVAIIFSAAGFITGIWAQNFDQMGIFSTFLITPLIYLGGIFYSVSMLPTFWQHVSTYNPMLYFINGVRYGILGISDVDLRIAAVVIVVLAILTVGISYQLYARGYRIKS